MSEKKNKKHISGLEIEVKTETNFHALCQFEGCLEHFSGTVPRVHHLARDGYNGILPFGWTVVSFVRMKVAAKSDGDVNKSSFIVCPKHRDSLRGELRDVDQS